jgi:hypothetical protein
MNSLWRGAIAAVLGVAALVATAAPASAHAVEGAGPTNYLTRLQAVTPADAGVEVRILEFGNRIEVRNTTNKELIVRGYDGEPYLRIGPRGVSQNMRSKATYLNADRYGETTVPATADPKAEPDWAFVSEDPVTQWHDHRVHWMGEEPPPAVNDAPDKVHTIYDAWKIPMTLDGTEEVVATGDLRWVPGPSPIPWLLLAIGSAAALIGATFTKKWKLVLGIGTAVLVVVSIVQSIGIAYAPGTTGSPLGRVNSGGLYLVPAWISGIVGARNLLMNKGDSALAALICAVIAGFTGGIMDIGGLFSSQIAFAWSAALARAFVALSLGLAVGILVGDFIAWTRHQKPMLEAVAAPG